LGLSEEALLAIEGLGFVSHEHQETIAGRIPSPPLLFPHAVEQPSLARHWVFLPLLCRGLPVGHGVM
jgi:hypothetical protein